MLNMTCIKMITIMQGRHKTSYTAEMWTWLHPLFPDQSEFFIYLIDFPSQNNIHFPLLQKNLLDAIF